MHLVGLMILLSEAIPQFGCNCTVDIPMTLLHEVGLIVVGTALFVYTYRAMDKRGRIITLASLGTIAVLRSWWAVLAWYAREGFMYF